MADPPRKPPRKTVQLCNVAHDPSNPASPRCMLSEGHEPKPHECITRDGKKLTWS